MVCYGPFPWPFPFGGKKIVNNKYLHIYIIHRSNGLNEETAAAAAAASFSLPTTDWQMLHAEKGGFISGLFECMEKFIIIRHNQKVGMAPKN
jgi:hypothetical protein